jgi:hypothetical protein
MGGFRRWAAACATGAGFALVPAAAPGQYQDPNPPPKPKTTVTLTANRDYVRYRKPFTLRGKMDPPPAQGEEARAYIGSEVPGVQYHDQGEGQVDVAPDGTFELVLRPEHNRRYSARVTVKTATTCCADYSSNAVTVYVDWDARTYWRRRPGGVLEALMIIRAKAESGLDYLSGEWAYFYGARKVSDRSIRRLFRARVYYTNDSSQAHPAAYARRRVRRPGRVKYMLSCVPHRPVMWGHPEDPLHTSCGKPKIAFPAP